MRQQVRQIFRVFKILKFNIYWNFQKNEYIFVGAMGDGVIRKNEYFCGYENYVEIFGMGRGGVITKLGEGGHFYAF